MADSGLSLKLNVVDRAASEASGASTKRRGQDDVADKVPRKKKKLSQRTQESGSNEERARGGQDDFFEGDVGGHEASVSAPVISSLFHRNPDIPHVELGDVRPVHEDVFSSRNFADIAGTIHPYLVQKLEKTFGIVQMTSVQAKAIPVVLAGKDALIKSQTGSGKTLAFALPLIHRLQELRPEITRKDGVHVLIITPTRELAVQSLEVIEKLSQCFARIVPGGLSGGEKKKSEKARLRKGINVLVATPGRLVDHLQHTKSLSLKNLKYLVLDEADRMLELGYERDVKTVLNCISSQCQLGSTRQTLMLSATLTTGIEHLSEVSMKRPVFVDAAVDDLGADDQSKNEQMRLKSLTTPERLKQTFIIVPAKLRLVTLASFILWKCRFVRSRKMLVFFATQDMVDFHAELFRRCLNHKTDADETPVAGDLQMTKDARAILSGVTESEKDIDSESEIDFLQLHGSMTQKDRLQVFRKFRDCSSGVLMCTDVAARGLDLPQVDWIVQFNPPVSKADYVHRVGRTARIGAKGSSLLFLLPSEAGFVKVLESEQLLLAEMTINQVLQKMFQNADQRRQRRSGSFSMEKVATDLQMQMERIVVEDTEMHNQASQAYVSYVRSYASYPKEARDIFCFKELHLGHIAKSFALRDPPTKITGLGKGHWVKNEERRLKQKGLKEEEKVIKAQKRRINEKALILSEYQSGLDKLPASAGTSKSKRGKSKKKAGARKFVRHPRKSKKVT